MKRAIALFLALIIVSSLALLGDASALVPDKDALVGYSYGEGEMKIEDISVKIVSSKVFDGKLTGTAVLMTPSESIALEFSNLELGKVAKGEPKDYVGMGVARTKEGDKELAVAISKNLDRMAGSIDYIRGEDIMAYGFLAGKNIPSLEDIKRNLGNGGAEKRSEKDVQMGLTNVGSKLANNVYLQVYGPSAVRRSDGEQPFQMRVRQSLYDNESWVNVVYFKVWANAARNGGNGFAINRVNPTSEVGKPVFSVSLGIFGIDVDTYFNKVVENHDITQCSWIVYPTDNATTFYYTGSNYSTNASAMEIFCLPLSGTGSYYCTGWVSAEFKFYDTLSRYYITRSNKGVPYYITIQN